MSKTKILRSSISDDELISYAESLGYGEIHYKLEPKLGLKSIIAIHSTTLGPALGGCRFIKYRSFHDGVKDVLRLGQGMSYKAALANLAYGGGKSVIFYDDSIQNRSDLLKCFAEFINNLNGRYITAVDSGTSVHDMDIMASVSDYVSCTSCEENGDPSAHTARGVFRGIQAAVKFKLDRDDLNDVLVAIQGVGHVGYHLCKMLVDSGAKVTIADMQEQNAKRCQDEFGVKTVSIDTIMNIPCDVFAPCALGAIINDATVSNFNTKIIAGSANNQLLAADHGQMLKERGILYAPDYVINVGGLIRAIDQYEHNDYTLGNQKIEQIYDRLYEIFERAQLEDKATNFISDELAETKLHCS